MQAPYPHMQALLTLTCRPSLPTFPLRPLILAKAEIHPTRTMPLSTRHLNRPLIPAKAGIHPARGNENKGQARNTR